MGQQKIGAYVIDLDAYSKKLDTKLDKSQEKLRKYHKEAKKTEQKNGRLSKTFGDMANRAAILEGPLGGTAGRLSSISTGLKSVGPAGIVAGLGITALTLAMTKGVAVYGEYEAANYKTEALIKATGNAAGFTSKQLQDLANETALDTLASVGEIKSAINVLQTFKAVQGDVFTTSIALSQDLASVMGGSAQSSATMLGKALEDPATGLTALKRAGVSFTQAEKERIKALQDSNRLAAAQALILEKIKGQVGGAGKAVGLTGSMDTLGQRTKEFGLALATVTGAGKSSTVIIEGMAKAVNRLNHELNPDDKSRLDQLVHKRLQVQKLIAAGNKRAGAVRQQQLRDINAEIKAIQDRRIEEQKAEAQAQADAEKAAAEARKENELAAAAEREKKRKEQSAREFSQLKESLKSKNQLIQDSYQKRRQMVMDNTTAGSEQQWQLLQQVEQQRQAEQLALMTQQQQEQAQRKQQLLQEQRAQELAEAAGFNSVKEQQEQEHQDRLLEATKQRKAKEDAIRQQGLQAFGSTMGQSLQLLEKSGKKQSSLYKTMFVAQKAAQIPMMLADTAKASTAAMAALPGPAGIALSKMVAALGYANVGMVTGLTMAGAYEQGGIIPGSSWSGDNLVARVNSGEMVLNRGQQAQLFDMANGRRGGGGDVHVSVQLIEDAERAGQVTQEQNDQGEIIIQAVVANIRSSTDITDTLSSVGNFQRVGS